MTSEERIKKILEEETEEEKLSRQAFILMANYLSEIERLLKKRKIKRKDLAKQIGTSPAYLTKVFRGDAKLNFFTLAKIQQALNIRFFC